MFSDKTALTIRMLTGAGMVCGEKQTKRGISCMMDNLRMVSLPGLSDIIIPDGTLKAVSVLSEDGKIARTQSFAGNGRKIAEGNYREEKKDSTWKYYSDLDGILISEETYLSG